MTRYRDCFLAGSPNSFGRAFRRLLRFRFDDVETTCASPFVSLFPKSFALRSSHPFQLFVELELPLVNVVQEFLYL